jgi:hypothetical protein
MLSLRPRGLATLVDMTQRPIIVQPASPVQPGGLPQIIRSSAGPMNAPAALSRVLAVPPITQPAQLAGVLSGSGSLHGALTTGAPADPTLDDVIAAVAQLRAELARRATEQSLEARIVAWFGTAYVVSAPYVGHELALVIGVVAAWCARQRG